MISDKVGPHHLEHKAILCVRQSSAHQVLHNCESSALQYAMRKRLTALGWSEINDRLLLGPKGSPNEYEMDLLRQSSLAASYKER